MQKTQIATNDQYMKMAEMSDIQKAMRRLYALPSRGLPEGLTEPEKADIRRAEVENIISALRGVTAYALSEAVERIMQNALGHKWMPLPPELRGLCDQIMKPILDARRAELDIQRHVERQRAERKEREEIQATWTPESRALATAKWEAAKAQQRLDNAAEETRRDQFDTSPDACMARLKAAAEANGADFNLDKIKNAPSGQFIQAGRAA